MSAHPCVMLTRRDRPCGRWASLAIGHLTYCRQHYDEVLDALVQATWEAGAAPEPSAIVARIGAAELARRKANADAIQAQVLTEHQEEMKAFEEAMRLDHEQWLAAQPPKPEIPTGPVVYFVRNEDNGAIKIGTALDAGKRLTGLRTSSPAALTLLATIPGDRAEEQTLHARFAAHRIRGEWFQPAPDLLAFVESIAA